MTELHSAVLLGALFGPAVAGVAWLAFARRPTARWVAGWGLGLASHAAAWWVLWLAYRGRAPAWQGLEPDLLMATVVVATQLGILVGLTRLEARAVEEVPAVVVGVAVGTSALVAAAWSTSLVVLGLALPVPTLGAALAGLSAAGRPDVRGHLGMGLADALALAGLSVVFAGTGSTAIGPASGAGPALLLSAAALKLGVVPGVGTWRLAGGEGPAAAMAPIVRGQGVVLAALAGLVMAPAPERWPLAAAAAGLLLLSGVAGALASRPAVARAALAGAGGALPLVALGLGGAVGARAFLLLFPPLLVAAALVPAVSEGPTAGRPRSRPAETEAPTVGPRWRWLGAITLAASVASLVGLPGGGGFPGTWLTLSLAAVRAQLGPLWLVVAGAAAVGLGLALLGAVPLFRWARPPRAAAALGAVPAAALVYAGVQPVRLGIGWWLRIEADLGLPVVLPAAGAPSLPPIPGFDLLWAFVPAALVGGGLLLLGRDLRRPGEGFAPLRAPRPARRRSDRPRRAPVRLAVRIRARASALALGFAVAMVLEVAAAVMAVRLLFLGARIGFL